MSEQFFLGDLLLVHKNDFDVGLQWLEGQPLNPSTKMFVDVMEMPAGRRLSDTIVVSCV